MQASIVVKTCYCAATSFHVQPWTDLGVGVSHNELDNGDSSLRERQDILHASLLQQLPHLLHNLSLASLCKFTRQHYCSCSLPGALPMLTNAMNTYVSQLLRLNTTRVARSISCRIEHQMSRSRSESHQLQKCSAT